MTKGTDNNDDINWVRVGNNLEVSYKGTIPTPSDFPNITFLIGKDSRSKWQKFKDWFNYKFRGGPDIIYMESIPIEGWSETTKEQSQASEPKDVK